MLNGFPAVNHGVSGCRRVVESVNVPVQVRHGTPDARLLTEIAYAGGFTSYEGGGISYNLPYCKNVPMETTIANWQYVDRLTGLYEEMGVSINREPYGPLTGTLVPPCISHAVAIIEALLAAEQGVKNITVGYGQCGNLIQDIAAVRTLEELTEEYLAKYLPDDLHFFVQMRVGKRLLGHHADDLPCAAQPAGVLDVPFAPCRFNAGQMLPCRDNDGAVRIMNMGNLPFTKELRDYHMGKIAERAAFEHRKATFQMVTDDVYAISKGRLVGRPR